MEKKKIDLKKGYVLVYDFGNIKLHNYATKDLLEDQVILLEKNHKLVIIESPTFYDNNEELESYITSLGGSVEGVLLSYHMGGGHFLENTSKYATEKANEFGHVGGGKNLIDGFASSFGPGFDEKIHDVTDFIQDKEFVLGDIQMNIIPTRDAFDIEIPEIHVLYTHMLGSDCHSIVAGEKAALDMIKELEGYIQKNYVLIVTSHYIPEGIEAVHIKISYLKNLVHIAHECSSKEEMIDKVEDAYPNYNGENYLEMTASFFFPEN